MPEFETTVRVQVRKPGDISDRIEWVAADVELEAGNLRAAAVEALRQATGDAALELGVNGTSGEGKDG